jgi:hypothetical protein
VLIAVDGWRLLTDPTFDPPGRKYRFGWGTGSVKLAGPSVPASELGRIDAILFTHDPWGAFIQSALQINQIRYGAELGTCVVFAVALLALRQH